MTSKPLHRRDFLKLLGITPLLLLKQSEYRAANLPNILILIFDALTARNMSLYGYPRLTTPNLERIANCATIYHRHYASGNFTTPGTASLFTGVYPWTHRALQLGGYPLNQFKEHNIFGLLSKQFTTFAYTHNPFVHTLFSFARQHINQLTKISDLAIISHAVADRWFSPDYIVADQAIGLTLKHSYGLSGSLYVALVESQKRTRQIEYLNDVYHPRFPRGLPNCRNQENNTTCFLLEDAMDWIMLQAKANRPAPYFGYVHLFPPHAPYNPSKQFIGSYTKSWQPPSKPEHYFLEGYSQKQLNIERKQYDEYIAYVDAEFGRLYNGLKESGALDNTYLILTSDHGEMFERGVLGHNTPTLYEPILHIPLLIFKPGQKTREDIFTPTSAVDLLPTALHIAGEPIPDWCEGQTLPGFPTATAPSERSIFAVEAKQNPKNGLLKKASFAIINNKYKLIHYTGYDGLPDTCEAYNLEEDPEELVDLYDVNRPVFANLEDELYSRITSSQP